MNTQIEELERRILGVEAELRALRQGGAGVDSQPGIVRVGQNLEVAGALRLGAPSALWEKISDKPSAAGWTPAWENLTGTLVMNSGYLISVGQLRWVGLTLQAGAGAVASVFGSTRAALPTPGNFDALGLLFNMTTFQQVAGIAVLRQGYLYLPTFNLTNTWLSLSICYQAP